MPAQQGVKDVKPLVVAVFTVFCLANIFLLVISLLIAFKNSKFQPIPEDVGLGIRMLIFLVGAGLSWALGHWLYMRMVEGEIKVSESATAALVLLFAGLAFLGGFSWIWQTVFLILLVLMTLLGLSRVIGMRSAIFVLVLCLLAGVVLFFMLS
jgi:hypothetical protein